MNIIHHGDSLTKMRELEDKSVDLVLIDPPYNIAKDDWDNFGVTKKGYQPKEYTGVSVSYTHLTLPTIYSV